MTWGLSMQRGKAATCLLAFSLAMAAPSAARSDGVTQDRKIMGWLETVFLRPLNLRVTAKLDTGAKTSSLHAGNVEHFSRDGDPWVRFEFRADKTADPIRIERPLVRKAVIKERLSRSSTRDVVTLTICKNGRDYETEFTLNDRSSFNYPVLLGRSFLADVALVDSAATFIFKGDQDACGQRGNGSDAKSGKP